MKTLALVDGDLALGEEGYAVRSGSARVLQDLGVASREPHGVDRFHPGWGTILTRFIGQPMNGTTEQLVRSEITRLVSNYMLVQQTQIRADADKGLPSRYGMDEIVRGIRDITIVGSFDRMTVRVALLLATGETVQITNEVVG